MDRPGEGRKEKKLLRVTTHTHLVCPLTPPRPRRFHHQPLRRKSDKRAASKQGVFQKNMALTAPKRVMFCLSWISLLDSMEEMIFSIHMACSIGSIRTVPPPALPPDPSPNPTSRSRLGAKAFEDQVPEMKSSRGRARPCGCGRVRAAPKVRCWRGSVRSVGGFSPSHWRLCDEASKHRLAMLDGQFIRKTICLSLAGLDKALFHNMQRDVRSSSFSNQKETMGEKQELDRKKHKRNIKTKNSTCSSPCVASCFRSFRIEMVVEALPRPVSQAPSRPRRFGN